MTLGLGRKPFIDKASKKSQEMLRVWEYVGQGKQTFAVKVYHSGTWPNC